MKTRSLWIILAAFLAGCTANDAAENTMNVDENLTADNLVQDSNVASSADELIFCPVVEKRITTDDCDDLTRVESDVRLGTAAFNVPSPMIRDETKVITLVIDRRTPEEIAEIDASSAVSADPDTNAVAEVNASDALDNSVSNEVVANDEVGPDPRRMQPRQRITPGRLTPRQVVDPLEGETESLVPKVGRRMSADLLGQGFRIQSSTARSQEIPAGESATWEWSVTPLRSGAHVLTLRTIVEGEVGGKRYPLARTETVKSVEVEVSMGGKVADAFDSSVDWLNRMKLFLIGLAGVLGAAWAVRRAWKGSSAKGQE